MANCLLCPDSKEESEIIKLKCGHIFCWACFEKYLKDNLSPKIKCPTEFCYEMIRDNQIRKVLRSEDIEIYETLCLKTFTKTHYCLLAQCRTPVFYEDPDVQLECSKCTLYNCIKCKAAHGFISCKTFQAKSPKEKIKFCEAEMKRAESIFNSNKADSARKMLVELSTIDLVQNNSVFTCICESVICKGDGIQLQNCSHLVCRDCLVRSIVTTHKIPPLCPICPGTINDREIQVILTKQQLMAYEEKCKNCAKRNITHFQCQTPDCNELYDINDKLTEFTCKTCKYKNCVKCKAVHLNENCEQFQNKMKNDVNLKAIEEKIKKKELMRCPKCNNLIAKTTGCNWVQCSSCLTELCWILQIERWGPGGRGDTSGGCKCMLDGIPCDPQCTSTCIPHTESNEPPYIDPFLLFLIDLHIQMRLLGLR